MRKAASKKTATKKVTKKPVTKQVTITEEDDLVAEERPPVEELGENLIDLNDEEIIEDEGLPNEFSVRELDTYGKFLTTYSPVVITEDNSRLERRGDKCVIVVSYDRKIQNSMPKFIDDLEVVVE